MFTICTVPLVIAVTLYAAVGRSNALITAPSLIARFPKHVGEYTFYHRHHKKRWLRSTSSPVSEDTSSANNGGSSQTESMVVSNTPTANSKVIQEVEELRRKAKQLMEEANMSENELRQVSMSNKLRKNADLDDIINKLLIVQDTTSPIDDPQIITTLVTRLRTLHLSESKLVQVMERIYERETNLSRSIISDKTDATLAQENQSRDIDARMGWIDKLIAAQTILDQQEDESLSTSTKKMASTLSSRYRELKRADDEIFQRKLNMGMAQQQQQQQQQDDFIFLRPSNIDSSSSSNTSDTTSRLYDIPANATLTITIAGTEITGSRKNMTRLLTELVKLPLWFPSVFLPFVVRNPDSLDIQDLKKIRSELLIESHFKCTSWDSVRFAAIYRGDFIPLRKQKQQQQQQQQQQQAFVSTSHYISSMMGKMNTKNQTTIQEEVLSRVVFQTLLERMEQTGLSTKIQLFLLDDPEWRPGNPSQPEPSPVILALPRSVHPILGKETGGLWKPVVSALAILSTLFTSFAYAVSAYALNPTVFDAIVNKNDLSSLSSCIPIFFGVLGLSLIHELAHLITAKRLHLDIGIPTPLPSLQIGTFGNITPLRSFPETRSSLLDFALSGPLVCFSVSLIFLIMGVLFTIHSSAGLLPTFATVPAALFKSSLLVGSIVSMLAPKVMMLPLSQPIPVHPLFMIGLAGIVASALNLLPIGRLDGGRAATAVFGRRSSYIISILMLSYLAISALTGSSTTSVFWGFLVSVFQRIPEIPIRDEVSEVNNGRFALYVVSVMITFLVLAPFPGALTAI